MAFWILHDGHSTELAAFQVLFFVLVTKHKLKLSFKSVNQLFEILN